MVRRPPLAHVLPTAHDMAREYRVLAALQGTGIPVPHVIALCEDESVIGAWFYVMEWIDGHVVRDTLPVEFPDTTETRRAMSSALIDTLLEALHAIDPDAIGLGDFGHPEGFLLDRYGAGGSSGRRRKPASCRASRICAAGSTRRYRCNRRRGSCTATTGSTTSCTRPPIRRASSR